MFLMQPAQAEIEGIARIEADNVPEYYSHGAGKAEIMGSDVRVTYYAPRGSGTAKVWVPVIEMIRPLASCGKGDMMRVIERALALERDAKPHH